MDYSKLVVVVSVLVPFLLKVSKRISSNLTIPAVPTTHLTTSQRLQVHKENAFKTKFFFRQDALRLMFAA